MRNSASLKATPSKGRTSTFLFCALILLVVFIVFQDVLHHQEFLVYDDDINVYGNPHLDPPSWHSIGQYWTDFYFSVYTPLANCVLAFIAHFAYSNKAIPTPSQNFTHLDSQYFHTANLIMHMLNALVVFGILRYIARSSSAACLGTLLFAIHPLQVEAVAWVTGWHTVFGGFFALTALWLYVVSIEARLVPDDQETRETETSLTRRVLVSRSWWLFLGATVFFVAALLSKPIFLIVPLVAFALDWGLTKRTWLQRSLYLLPWLCLALFFSLVNQMGQSDNKMFDWTGIYIPIQQRPFVVGDALTFYLKQLLIPLSFGPDYGRTPQWALAQKSTYFIWLIPVSLTVLAIYKRRTWPALSTAIILFFIATLPTSGIVSYYFHAYSTVADRYTYLAMLGPALLLAWLSIRFYSKVFLIGTALVLALLGSKSTYQTYYYSNSISFFEHGLEVNPASWLSFMNLGVSYSAVNRDDDALQYLLIATRLHTTDPRAFYNLGLTLSKMNRPHEALAAFEKAISINPAYPMAYTGYAFALHAVGRNVDALRAMQTALRLDSQNAEFFTNFGNIYLTLGRVREAQACYEKALKLKPSLAAAQKNLKTVNALFKKGEAKLTRLLNQVKVKPNDPQIRWQLAQGLLEANDQQGAIEQLRYLLTLQPKDARAHYQLGMVYKLQGQQPKALDQFQQAFTDDPKQSEAAVEVGVILVQQGKIAQGIPYFRKAINLHPDYSIARHDLASALIHLGKRGEAIAQWGELLKRDPGFIPARQALAQLGLHVVEKQSSHNAK